MSFSRFERWGLGCIVGVLGGYCLSIISGFIYSNVTSFHLMRGHTMVGMWFFPLGFYLGLFSTVSFCLFLQGLREKAGNCAFLSGTGLLLFLGGFIIYFGVLFVDPKAEKTINVVITSLPTFIWSTFLIVMGFWQRKRQLNR